MLLVIFCSFLVTFSSFLVNFCSFSITKLRHRYFSCKFSRFWLVFLDGGFQSFLNMRNHFQSCHKVTNIVSIDIALMPLLQYLDTFSSTLCTWTVGSSRPEKFYKEGVLKNSTKFTGKHLRRGLFCNKAAGWRPATSLNKESFRWILRNL